MTATPDEIFRAVDRLLEAAAPERRDELASIWKEYSPRFVAGADRAGFTIHAGAFGSVIFTHKSIAQIWLLGFAAWRAVEAYSGLVWWLDLSREPFKAAEIVALPGQGAADASVENLMAAARELETRNDLEGFNWPADVPPPGTQVFPRLADKAAFDLICIATAYVLLHEVQHIRFVAEGNAPADPIAEEMACDRFARDFLTERIASYSTSSGYPFEKVLTKRALAFALAAFVLLAITPIDRWGGSDTHPAVGTRIRTVLTIGQLRLNSMVWIVVNSFLLAMLRHTKKLPAQITFNDPENLFEKLVALL